MTISCRPLALAAALSLLAASALTAQTPAPAQLAPAPDTANPNRQPTRLAQPGGVALSPDGTSVTYSLGGRRGGGLHVVSVADPKDDKTLAPTGPAGCSSSDPAWSPDSQWLAFTSTCYGTATTSQEQILLWSKSTGEFKQLTHLKGNLQQLAWSPDGKAIAFLFVENATRSAGALDAMPPWDGVIGEDHVEIQRVYGVSIASGLGQWITPPSLHVYEFAYNPARPEVTYIAANPPGENTWWIAKLYTQSLYNLDSSKPNAVLDTQTVAGPLHKLQIAVPRYSPDGKQIAFIGGLMSDQGSTGGDIWVVPAKGGAPVDITPNIDGTPSFFAWINDNRIGIVEERRGRILLPDYDVAKRAYIEGSVIDLGEVSISGGTIKDAIAVSNPMKSFALVQSSYKLAPEVYLGTESGLTQLTHLNATAPKSTVKFESVEWENEGFHVQGWLTFPKDYDAHKKYPIIVEVHGGPSASAGPRPSTAWSEQGYFVLAPNPRGSFGQGEKFVQANVKDFGYGDLRDILKGLDTVEAKYPIDKHREGLTGWSYGGFMSMFAETQTTRFAAIVAGAGISNWQSYYGENSIDQWMVPFFGATVYDDPKVYAKSSAIEFIKNAKTPMLIIVGDRDGECPAPQSFEMWHALKAEGVTTQLVIYPNEGHGFRNPAHIADRMEREVKWFAQYMPEDRK
jgi:dipeptidyl aminopeptidase/acylaminoacyl peptidase